MRVLGLMSGTSADGIDAALVDWPDDSAARPFELIGYRETPHESALQAEIHRLAAGDLPAGRILEEQVRLDRVLGDAFADAVEHFVASTGVALEEIDAIASHGQTIAHHPEHGGTLQIGCPATIAERLRRPVVADFRRRDAAMGGEGAPLAPFFHHAVFADSSEARGVLNLGGIANLTWLPAGCDASERAREVMAFDVGPANSLVDGVVSLATDGRERFDRDGQRARAGNIIEAWRAELAADPYLDRAPPKSTGRERYGIAEARSWLARAAEAGVSTEDLIATLVIGSVDAIARSWRELSERAPENPAGRLLVGGGGALNPFVMEALAESMPGVHIEPMDVAGVPADAAEAMAFSLLGRNALLGLPNQLPQCTGVDRAAVLGVVHGAEWLRRR